MAQTAPKPNPAEQAKTAAQAANSVPELRAQVAVLADLVGELLQRIERLERR